jgi:phospholipase C
VLDALVANPKVWSKTVLVVMYDENDGWFDHVPPPVPPANTKGEVLTTSTFPTGEPNPETLGIKGPLGLGVRVPCLIVSPFSRGGHVASEVFDHTSQLKLVAERWGVKVPNVSAWRRKTVGDLTSAMFQSKPNAKLPKLPKTSVFLPADGVCAAGDQETESGGASPSFPTKQRMPNQNGGTVPASTFFKPTAESEAISDDDRTEFMNDPAHPRPVTTKSQFNSLAKV